jgi:Short C-terminal domain
MPLMRRRPLLRAAAVGGGAYMAGKRRAANQDREAGQEERISDLEQQGPPPAQSGVSSNGVERLRQLGQLHEEGVLTDEEFAQQKAKILSSG